MGSYVAESRLGVYDNSQRTAVTLAVKLTRVRSSDTPYPILPLLLGSKHAHVPMSGDAHVPDGARNFPSDNENPFLLFTSHFSNQTPPFTPPPFFKG
ncbi:hypothetical protein Csa_003603 [Cucumis sativus]|uniref:Uncharacterized protein n=1 Tax=Cucumis sativus TaxID=3659 RepID=A0A0A0KHQ3_CUCSA|nr:hypothetical protein Csa_003603 [Cucumis sativus]